MISDSVIFSDIEIFDSVKRDVIIKPLMMYNTYIYRWS